MSAGNFHVAPKVSDSVEHLDPNVVTEVLSRHAINVSDAAAELGVASADLRRLLWARPQLTAAAAELVERRLDKAEKTIAEALDSEDPRTRLAASMFTLRNSHRARRRGWITSSTSAAELSVGTGDNRAVVFRWRDADEDASVGAAAEAEAEARGQRLISVGWGRPGDGKTIEHDDG